MADIIFPDQPATGVLGSNRLPQNIDMTFWKGDSQEFVVKFKNELGAPMTITGYTPLAVIKSSFNSPTSYTLTTTVQNTNEVKVYLPSSISKTIPAGEYIWNLQLTAPNGDVRTYLAGDVVVYAEVD